MGTVRELVVKIDQLRSDIRQIEDGLHALRDYTDWEKDIHKDGRAPVKILHKALLDKREDLDSILNSKVAVSGVHFDGE